MCDSTRNLSNTHPTNPRPGSARSAETLNVRRSRTLLATAPSTERHRAAKPGGDTRLGALRAKRHGLSAPEPC